jgi:hypothetical protein
MFKRWRSISESVDEWTVDFASIEDASRLEDECTPYLALRLQKITNFSHPNACLRIAANFYTGTKSFKLVYKEHTDNFVMQTADRLLDAKIYCDLTTSIPHKSLFIEFNIMDDQEVIARGRTENLLSYKKNEEHAITVHMSGTKTAKLTASLSLKNM